MPGGVERHDQLSAMINSADAAAARDPAARLASDRGFELVGSGGNFHGIQLWVNLPGIRSSSEPVVHYAPFVMNSKSSVIQAVEDFQAGKFGNIPPNALMPPTTPVDSAADGAVFLAPGVEQFELAELRSDGDQRQRRRHCEFTVTGLGAKRPDEVVADRRQGPRHRPAEEP